MYRHMSDAMKLNRERAKLYADISHGASRPVSEAMLAFEGGLLRSTSVADLAAYPFQLSGIPIVCADYVSMANTPPFRSHYLNGAPAFANFQPPDQRSLTESLRAALKKNDYAAIVQMSDRELLRLKEEPRFNCLYRHFVESIRRIASLAPHYQIAAQTLVGREGVRFISNQMLKGHFKSLEEATQIDALAAPVQAMNVPILCNDVPPIPPVRGSTF